MPLVQVPNRSTLVGTRRGATTESVVLAAGFYLFTLLLWLVGRVLLANWRTATAHLTIELLAVLLFVSAIGAATLNGYRDGGLVGSIVLMLSLITGVGTVVSVTALTSDLGMSTPVAVESLGTLVGLVVLIGACAFVVGLSVRQLLRVQQWLV